MALNYFCNILPEKQTSVLTLKWCFGGGGADRNTHEPNNDFEAECFKRDRFKGCSLCKRPSVDHGVAILAQVNHWGWRRWQTERVCGIVVVQPSICAQAPEVNGGCQLKCVGMSTGVFKVDGGVGKKRLHGVGGPRHKHLKKTRSNMACHTRSLPCTGGVAAGASITKTSQLQHSVKKRKETRTQTSSPCCAATGTVTDVGHLSHIDVKAMLLALLLLGARSADASNTAPFGVVSKQVPLVRLGTFSRDGCGGLFPCPYVNVQAL